MDHGLVIEGGFNPVLRRGSREPLRLELQVGPHFWRSNRNSPTNPILAPPQMAGQHLT